jgi:hypothetical protein
MPFSTPAEQLRFDNLLALIRENKSTEIDYYKEPRQWWNGQRPIIPAEWQNWGRGTDIHGVTRTIHAPFNEYGSIFVLYKWKVDHGVGYMLSPAFHEHAQAGLRLEMPHEISSADLNRLFAAIAQNDAFAAQVVEIDFTNCTKLTERVVFPKNLINVQNLIMDRMSLCSYLGSNVHYDAFDGGPIYYVAEMGTPDISSLQNLKRLSIIYTVLNEWPELPKTLVEYLQYGSSPMCITRLNLSASTLPDLRIAHLNVPGLTEAYAICLARSLQARPELSVSIPHSSYQFVNDGKAYSRKRVFDMPLTVELLDVHFNQIVGDGRYANRRSATEADLWQCANVLKDLLAGSDDHVSQAVLTDYIANRLPALMAHAEDLRMEKLMQQEAQRSFVRAANKF